MKNLVYLLSTIVILSCQKAEPLKFVHTNGTEIVDGDNRELIFRGIGLGGWMLQEGYMLGTDGTQHEIEARIDSLVGRETRDLFYEKWYANHTRKVDIDSLAAWGFNMVRLPMHYKHYTPAIEDEPISDEITWLDFGFAMTDSLVSWCKANGMYLILDLHAAPGGQGKNASISDYDPSKPSLWESELNQKKTVALWRKLAERYANETTIAGYDLLNETNWGFSDIENDPNGLGEKDNSPLWDLQRKITEAIREVDTSHMVIIEGNGWGNNYNNLPELWDDNLVISYHKYWNHNKKEEIQHMLNMREERNVPIWLGETGENSNQWFADCVELLENNKIGWAWWPLKKFRVNNPLRIALDSNYQKILNYWNDGAPKPSEDEARTGLMKYAENLKLENCHVQRDMIDALIRSPHTKETVPFVKRTLLKDKPLVIQATDYDMGKNGFAYSDSVIQNLWVSTGDRTNWNEGWTYRNDGVDIQDSEDTDPQSNGFNVGWIAENEWTQYTLDVVKTADYQLSIRYAGNGQIRLEVDGEQLGESLELPNTNDYQTWQTAFYTSVPLTEGVRAIRVICESPGFNLGFLVLE